MKDIVIIGPVSSADIFAADAFVSYVAWITPELGADIQAMAQIVRDHRNTARLDEVRRFDYTVDYLPFGFDEAVADAETLDRAADEKALRVEIPCLSVTATEFWWNAVPKHQDKEVRTDLLPLSVLDLKPGVYRFRDGVPERANAQEGAS